MAERPNTGTPGNRLTAFARRFRTSTFRLLPMFVAGGLSCSASTFYLTVAGLGGEPDYEQRFALWASELDSILKSEGPDAKISTLKGPDSTRANVRAAFEKIAREAKPDDVLVLMLIGHGSYDGVEYKINLPGPDLSAAELNTLLNRVAATRQLVVNMTSASGGSIEALRKDNRVLITATKSGTERNATVFARYWVEALRDAAADADKNETISALEAFHYAQHKVTDYYDSQKRLATEHALLEDTGSGAGVRTPSSENSEGLRAAAFPVVRLGAAKAVAGDPRKRALVAKKDQIEQQIDELKYRKAALAPEEYKKHLTALLVELAKTQEELDK